MTPHLNRRWYHASWFTWLLLVIVAWALVDFQLQRRGFSFNITFGSVSGSHYYGWPFKRLDEHTWQRTEVRSGIIDHGPQFSYKSHALALGLNGLCILLLIVSTFYVCEHLWRRWHRFQFSVRSGLIFTGTLASGLALYRQSAAVEHALTSVGLEPIPFYFHDYYEHFSGWLVMLALACTGLALLSFACWATDRLLFRTSHVPAKKEGDEPGDRINESDSPGSTSSLALDSLNLGFFGFG
jgi:hypothetical protein